MKTSAGDAEERGRRHVVAGDGEAVLEARDAAARRIEIGGRSGLHRGAVGDPQRADHEEQEHADRNPVEGLLLDGAEIGTSRQCRSRREGAARESRARSIAMEFIA